LLRLDFLAFTALVIPAVAQEAAPASAAGAAKSRYVSLIGTVEKVDADGKALTVKPTRLPNRQSSSTSAPTKDALLSFTFPKSAPLNCAPGGLRQPADLCHQISDPILQELETAGALPG
jgi:hypothetical protein